MQNDSGSLLKNIRFCGQGDRLEFGCDEVSLTFGKEQGEWRTLRAMGLAQSLIAPPPGSATIGVDFRVNGAFVVEQNGWTKLRHETGVAPGGESVSLSLVYGVGDEYELTSTFTLFPGAARVDRSARVVRVAGSGAARFEGFVFRLPGVAPGDPSECLVDVPGPWWPQTYHRPGARYTELAGGDAHTIEFHGAPDAGFGLVVLRNPFRNAALAAWMDTGGEVNCHPALVSDGTGRLTITFSDHRYYRLTEHAFAASDVQCTRLVHGSMAAVLGPYRQMVERTMPLDPKTPNWVREAVILEAYPPYFADGFRGITAKLFFYRKVGFNTLYLMPHWKGGYSPIDPFAVEPSYGTPDDLRALVREAHRLGMKVLFDMVIHGFHEQSPLVTERPDLFIRNEDGSMVRHASWGSISTDWASSAYQRFMADLARHDLREYDIDGYRVDAASYKGASWDPSLPYPAYRSGSASPELMAVMLAALRETRPDAVLLSEIFGPVFSSVCNFAHDNQAEAVPFFLEQMDAGKTTAADYKEHLACVFDLLPPGANRVFYGRNHDASWFYRFGGYTPRFLAIEAIHALCAIPEVFAGDPAHGPHPDDDPAVWEHYRRLFALREVFPELARGDLLLREVSCDNPNVFTALRRLDNQSVLVVISLSDKTEKAALAFSAPIGALAAGGATMRDVQTGKAATSVWAAENDRLLLDLQPFQSLVGRGAPRPGSESGT